MSVNDSNVQYEELVEKLKRDIGIGAKKIAIFPCLGNLGDIYYALSQIPHIADVLQKKIVVLLCGSKAEELASYFLSEKLEVEVYLLTAEEAKTLKNSGKEIALFYDEILKNTVFNKEIYEMIYTRNKSEYKFLTYPKFPEFDASFYIKEYGVIPGKTIFISPFANTIKTFPDYFWNFCAEIFRYLGYHVLFNVQDVYAKRFHGKNAFIPISDAVEFSNLCGHVFGMRSGFFDLISTSTARMVIFSVKIYAPIDIAYNISNVNNRIHTIYTEDLDLNYEKFLPIKFVKEHYKPVLERLEKQINVWQKLFYVSDYEPAYAESEPVDVAVYAYFKYGNKIYTKKHSHTIVPFIDLKYSFRTRNGIIFLEIHSINFEKYKLNLLLYRVINEKKKLVSVLEDYHSRTAVFVAPVEGEYIMEIVVTDIETRNQTIFYSEEIYASVFEPYRSNELSLTTDFVSYIEALYHYRSEIVIFIVSKDAHTASQPNEKTKKLRLLNKLGIQTDMETTYRNSFVCIINEGAVEVEKTEQNKEIMVEYILDDIKVNLKSEGYNVRKSPDCVGLISIGNDDWSVNARGLNFVVWNKKDKKVVDSVCFDTYKNGKVIRLKGI